jgi:CRISPR system Cascade subunit CasE
VSALHLVRLPVDLAALGRWSAERGLGWAARRGRGGRAAEGYDEGAALHHLLGEAFGSAALQPFRLLVAPVGGSARVYGYAATDAAALRATAHAGLAPEMVGVLDLAGLASCPMPAAWAAGRRLGFDLRLRPVVRLGAGLGDHRKGAEVDAFLAEALRRPPGEMERSGRTREAVYRDWLARRLDEAAALEDARLIRFQRVRAARKGALSEGPDAVLQGTLSVRCADAFADILRRGVGRHRAYGYGMLLLRPPSAKVPRC